MFNKIILQATLTRDIELRYTGGGAAIAKLGLACNDTWKDQNGQKHEEVLFIDGNIFGKAAEVANKYLSKGSKVLISGKLVLEQWQDQNGQKRSKHSIKIETFDFLDTKSSNGQANNQGQQQNEQQQSRSQSSNGQANNQGQQQMDLSNVPQGDDIDQEIPF